MVVYGAAFLEELHFAPRGVVLDLGAFDVLFRLNRQETVLQSGMGCCHAGFTQGGEEFCD